MGSSKNYTPSPQQVNPNINNPNITMPAPAGYQKIKWDGRGGMGGAMRNSMNNLAGQQKWQAQQNYQNDQNGMNAYNAGNSNAGGMNGYSPQPQLNVGTYENTIEQPKTTFNPYFGNYLNY